MDRFDITVIPSIIFGVILKGGIYYTRDIKFGMCGIRTRSSSSAQGPEEMCLSLEHETRRKPLKNGLFAFSLPADVLWG